MAKSCSTSQLSELVILFLLMVLSCFATSSMASRPAFLFTRHRGRCTPQYWGSRIEEWPKMVPQRSTVSRVFGSRAIERFTSDMTLLEAATRNDDVENAYARLLKQSSAALLNSYARVGFPYRAWEVKILLLQGLISENDAAQQAQLLKKANEACN